MEVVRIYPKKCNLSKALAQEKLEWRNKVQEAYPTSFDDDDDVTVWILVNPVHLSQFRCKSGFMQLVKLSFQ